jgi:hypothetical protein
MFYHRAQFLLADLAGLNPGFKNKMENNERPHSFRKIAPVSCYSPQTYSDNILDNLLEFVFLGLDGCRRIL